MAVSESHQSVEQRFLDLVAEAGLPRPDRIEYSDRSVEFFWDATKTVVIVDLDDPDG